MVGRFSSSEVGGEKKRASEVTKYFSTYARVEIIAKLRKKNVTASTGIKLVPWYARRNDNGFRDKGLS